MQEALKKLLSSYSASNRQPVVSEVLVTNSNGKLSARTCVLHAVAPTWQEHVRTSANSSHHDRIVKAKSFEKM